LNEQSVKNVLSTIYQKCRVRNRLELALFVARNKVLPEATVPEKVADEDFRNFSNRGGGAKF